jgi:uncharacterized membrane protein
MSKLYRFFLHLMATVYMLAGMNHFFRPDSYLQIMPPFIPSHELMNLLAGVAEVVLGLGLHFKATRIWAAWGVIAMLIAFLPVHIYFIQVDSCIENSICLPVWAGWVRLVIIHPLLLLWAYLYTRQN